MREEDAPERVPDSDDTGNGETPSASRRPGQAADGQECVELGTVRKDEWKEIVARRKELGLHTPETADEGQAQPKSNIVGLSLSGGGLRSAFFSLGFVQALHKYGLWRYLDYLSTVSGGGYLGGYLSSRVLRQQRAFDKDNFPLTAERGGRQSKDVQKLIHAGNLFFRPWGLLNKYLIGVLFNNVAFLSALIVCAALIALAWRCFDLPEFRDRARTVDLDSDFLAPFWPFWLCAFFWLGAWVFSYFRRGAEAPGHLARYALFATIASLLIGCALLVGNGDIAMGPTSDTEPWYVGGMIWGPIVGLILGGLLPFLRPGRLLRSGTDPKAHWEKHVFNVASTSLLVGLPLLFIGLIARENVSGYNTHRFRDVVKGDVQNWPAFCRLVLGFGVDAANQSESSEEAIRQNIIQNVSDAFGGRESPTSDANVVKELADAFREDKNNWLSLYPQMSLSDKKLSEQEEKLRTTHAKGSDPKSFRAQLLLGLLLREAELLESVYRESEYRWYDVPHHLFLAWRVFWEVDVDIADYWQAKQRGELLKEHLAEVFNTSVLPNLKLFETQVEAYRSEMARPPKREGSDGDTGANAKSSAPVGRSLDLDKRIDVLALGNLENVPKHEVKELNRLLLQHRFSDILRPRTEIRRVVSIGRDQVTRSLCALYALVVLLLVGLWVDLNATSMHRFYRNRLSSTFIVPHREKQPNVPLSDLDTTRFGSPYHIISGTVGLSWVDDQLGDLLKLRDDDDELASVGPTPRARNASFLFSRLYCGSSITGYVRTEAYESRIRGDLNRVDLAEAIAMSGAALSPVSVRNSLIAFLMFILNMRLGQWLPNPRCRRPKWRPTVFSLLLGLRKKRENRPYCFVTDGGNVDNLGLVQLLKRRCKLIIAVDAGCDPKHRFDDLARAISAARVYHGVKLVELRDDEQDADEMRIEPLRLREREEEYEGSSKISQEHFTLAKIVYPDEADGYPKEGLLVYVKPSFTGDECIDLWQYRQHNESFPHEPTSDQLYDEAQAEAYRMLGHHIGTQMAQMLLPLRGHETLWDDSCKTEVDGEALAFEFAEAHMRYQREKKQTESEAKKKTGAKSDDTAAVPGPKSKARSRSSRQPRKRK